MKALEDAQYYHGLLPREDIKVSQPRRAARLTRRVSQQMLKNNGDYLVRMTEPSQKGKREYVISVMYDKDKGTVRNA